MSDTKYDLDDGVSESFTFKMGGHVYTCTYPTIHEIREKFNGKDEVDPRENDELFFAFISERITGDEGAPEFTGAFSNLLLSQRAKFVEMIIAEFGGM